MSQLDLQIDKQEEGSDRISHIEPTMDRSDREFVGGIAEGSGSDLRSRKLGGKLNFEKLFSLNIPFWRLCLLNSDKNSPIE